MSSNPGHGPAISAHRGGSEHGPGGTYEAYQNALAIGADYVEFDVRQTRDGVVVALHEERARQGLRARPVATVSYSRLCQLSGFEVPQVAEVIRLLAGRARAHVDLKETGCAIAVTRLGLEVLGPPPADQRGPLAGRRSLSWAGTTPAGDRRTRWRRPCLH